MKKSFRLLLLCLLPLPLSGCFTALVGAGSAALADFGAATITDALRLRHPHVEVLGTGDELAVRLCGDLEADDIPIAHIHTEESH